DALRSLPDRSQEPDAGQEVHEGRDGEARGGRQEHNLPRVPGAEPRQRARMRMAPEQEDEPADERTPRRAHQGEGRMVRRAILVLLALASCTAKSDPEPPKVETKEAPPPPPPAITSATPPPAKSDLTTYLEGHLPSG